MQCPCIIWLRRDLRLKHHLAIEYAIKHQKPMVFIYIEDPFFENTWQMGAAQKVWLHASLKALQKQLQEKGAQLILRKGHTEQILKEVIALTQADTLLFHRCYDPIEESREQHIRKILADQITVEDFSSYLLFEPGTILNKQNAPFAVYTPFSKACKKVLELTPLKNTSQLIPYSKPLPSDSLESLELLPTIKWDEMFFQTMTPGEQGAHRVLEDFVQLKLNTYAIDRDFPSKEATSRLSAHLHFGEITPMQILYVIHRERQQKDTEIFINEILWREFSYHLLHYFPQFPRESFNKKFEHFEWDNSKEKLRAWQQGLTGFPIIDAGMRELWKTGWMHNRVRMITASFLTKDLFISWHEGEKWFWNTLLDADLANNAVSWQWVAGSGADAAPYFRIFNPMLQSKKFDPDGEYIKKWVPELKKLPIPYIHSPSEAPKEVLEKAQITLGQTYPYPIVDHAKARKEALRRFEKVKNV